MRNQTIICTVTNELLYDQRMIRICTTLAQAGYKVILVGRRYRHSLPLSTQPFEQYRIHCLFRRGKLFYAEYNFRLFCWLLRQPAHLLCAIDLDTILPVLWASQLKGIQRVYDAHELFCEMKEVVSRPAIYRLWKKLEGFALPRFPKGYTVSAPIRQLLRQEYGLCYEVIRNTPVLQERTFPESKPYILYQGAVNEGRSFETLIPAFQWIDLPLHIYGTGNFINKAKALAQKLGLEQKVLFMGERAPEALNQITGQAMLGLTLFENKGLSNYYSLANRFFDYIHAGIPQLCVAYPAYQAINQTFEVAELIEDLSAEHIARAINKLLANPQKLQTLRSNCCKARRVLNWQAEEKILLHFYQQILG